MNALDVINEELARIHDSLESSSVSWAIQDALAIQHAKLIQALLTLKARENHESER